MNPLQRMSNKKVRVSLDATKLDKSGATEETCDAAILIVVQDDEREGTASEIKTRHVIAGALNIPMCFAMLEALHTVQEDIMNSLIENTDPELLAIVAKDNPSLAELLADLGRDNH